MMTEYDDLRGEHDMLMGDLLERSERDREQFELESGRLARAMRKGASIAFDRAATECLACDCVELAKKFRKFSSVILFGPLEGTHNEQ